MHSLLPALKTRSLRFARDEDGSIVILSLFLIILMLVVAGMSVDIAHHEEQRALVQSTLDRSVLASASLDQTGDAAAAQGIVRDYFTKSGVEASLGPIRADVAINSRRVSATASASLNTFFMRMSGINTLTVPASSTAMEAAQDLEIVLVLDTSWSMQMDGSTRLANLRTAARSFVDTILANDTEHRVSISVVPFNGQVNLGPTLYNALSPTVAVSDPLVARNPTTLNHYCLDMPSTAFNQLSFGTTTTLAHAGHFDAWGGLAGNGGTEGMDATYRAPLPFGTAASDPWGTTNTPRLVPLCRLDAANTVQTPTSDLASLRTKVAGLTSGGFTSIYLGMKWGVVMLDPAFRPVIQRAGLPANLANRTERPFDWGRPNTMKIIVLMTDGEHQANHTLLADYRSGDAGSSNIWRRNASPNEYSRFISSRATNTTDIVQRCRPFWVPHLTGTSVSNVAIYQWQPRPWNGTAVTSSTPCYSSGATYTGVTALSWQEVWASLRMNWVAWQLYARSECGTITNATDMNCRNSAYQSALRLFRGPVSGTNTLEQTGEISLPEFYGPMDTKLLDTCHQAHQQGIIIYGIGFEVTRNQRGEQAIQNCVSDRGRIALTNYFYAEGLQIDRVFRTIAAQINALKLVQ